MNSSHIPGALLYASDTQSPFAERATNFLAQRALGPDVLYLTWPTIMSYLRIATHPAIFKAPLSPDDAMRNIRQLLDLPHVLALGEHEGFWDVYGGVAGLFPMRGNAVPAAHLAAVLRQHGVAHLYTNDADFKRFPFLTVVKPFDDSGA